MTTPIAWIVVAVLVAIATMHVYWASGGTAGKDAAIPSRDGRPVLSPSAPGTAFVAFVLGAIALLVAAKAGLLPTPAGSRWLSATSGLVAFVFGARAIGDFRYVGAFKSVKGSRFAGLDTWIYTPLCLGLAASIGLLAALGRTE